MSDETKKKKQVNVRMLKAGAYTKNVRKIDAEGISFQSKDVEDEFKDVTGVNEVIPVPFNPRWLKLLVTHNNTLNQAIAAMEINIDGSGFSIEAKEDGKEIPEASIVKVEQFFEEVSPGISFLALRRNLRRDLESCGYAFIEVIRNQLEEVVALKRVDASTVRLLKLGKRVLVEKILMRGGQELKVKMWVRERRFLQVVGNQKTYFSEFQASRKLNKNSGKWQNENESIKLDDTATELMYFTVDVDANGPYGVPRWINNLPSVLGSRKAEEENLNFFDNGGVPPVIITIMGGRLVGDVHKQLNNFLSGKTPNTRIAVLQAQDADGTVDGTSGKLKIDVQRFGSEKLNDSLFENYDEKCSERVRSSFRLPPLFIGKVREFNFATAKTAYEIAESQVFQPERVEFDEVMTKFIATELAEPDLRMRSLPISLVDSKVQFEGLKFAFESKTISMEQFLNALNSITSLGLTYDEALEQGIKDREEKDRQAIIDAANQAGQDDEDAEEEVVQNVDDDKPYNNPKRKPKKKYTITKDSVVDVTNLIAIARDLVDLIGVDSDTETNIESEKDILERYNKLKYADQVFVRDLISGKILGDTSLDKEGAVELLNGCLHTLDESEEEDGSD